MIVAGAIVLVLAATAAFVAINRAGDNKSGGSAGGRTGGDFHSLVVDPKNPKRLFVGGHEAVAVSEDGGRTWRAVESLANADAMAWGFTKGAIYVSGHPGLNRSTDGGRTFARVNDGLPNSDVHAFGAGDDDVLYGSSPVAGFFALTKGAGSWKVRSPEQGRAFFGRLVADPSDANRLFAADASAGVFESRDGGANWRALNAGLPAATWLSSTRDLGALVASGPAGAAISHDQGATWQALRLPAGASLVELSPTNPAVMYTGAHDGERVQIHISRNGGRTWRTP